MKSMPGIYLKTSVPSSEEISKKFERIFREKYPCDDWEYHNFLLKCENPETFMMLFIKLMDAQDNLKGSRQGVVEPLLFPMVDELNKAYGSCVVDLNIGYAGNHVSTYENYREEVEEHKRLMAKTFVWDLWKIKDVYAKTFHKAITETNGKVGKGTLVQALNDLRDAKIIYDYDIGDIILERDKNGNQIWAKHKSQVKSFFRPGNTVHGKLGPKYKEVIG